MNDASIFYRSVEVVAASDIARWLEKPQKIAKDTKIGSMRFRLIGPAMEPPRPAQSNATEQHNAMNRFYYPPLPNGLKFPLVFEGKFSPL